MGDTTYSDFKTYLKLRLGNSDAFDNFYGVWVNSAYKYLCSLDYVPGTKIKIVLPDLDTAVSETSVAAQPYVAKPTDALIINQVYDSTNETWLDWIPYSQYASKTDTDTSSAYGEPTLWTRRGNYIFIYPTPDDAYSILVDYRMFPASMSALTDVTELSAEWDSVILELATWTARNWIGEPEKAEYAKKTAIEMMTGLASIYGNEEKARREKLRPDYSVTERDSY
jgi:hypothetical protein